MTGLVTRFASATALSPRHADPRTQRYSHDMATADPGWTRRVISWSGRSPGAAVEPPTCVSLRRRPAAETAKNARPTRPGTGKPGPARQDSLRHRDLAVTWPPARGGTGQAAEPKRTATTS